MTLLNVRHPEHQAHIPQLDGIRGIAIALVLIWHYGNYLVAAPGSWGATFKSAIGLSWSGVDLFFVLSGFLIGGILIDSRTATNYWRVFYTRRSCRILPLYALVGFLFIAALAFAEFPWLTANSLPGASYLTFTQNFAMGWLNTFGANFMGATWSLAVEEQFYLLFPLIIRYTAPRLLPYVLLALIAAAPLVRIAIYHWFSKDHIFATYTLMPCRADALLIGVLCAWAMRNDWANRLLHRNPKILHCAFIVLLSGTIYLAASTPNYADRQMAFFGLTWVALFFASALLIATTQSKGVVRAISMANPLRDLGKIAYGVYLFHIPVVGLLHGLFLHQSPTIDTATDAGLTLLAGAVTILLAKLSLKYFEAPITDFGRKSKYDFLIHKRALLGQPPVARAHREPRSI